MKILIADDEKQCADTVAEILMSILDCEVEVVHSGQEALGIISASRCFDVLVTDFQMPGANGLQVSQAMRSKSASAKIVLMSGTVFSDAQQDEAQALGIKVLAKPFKLNELLQALSF